MAAGRRIVPGRARTALLLAVGVCTLGTLAAWAQQRTNPPYIAQFPTIERVEAELHGKDAMDTAAKRMGAFWQLQKIITDMSGVRWARNQLTADENRLIGQYRWGYQRAEQAFGPPPDHAKWYQAHAFYETSDEFREELFARFLSPELRAEYGRIKGETRAQLDAARRARARVQAQEQQQPQPDNAAQAAQALADAFSTLLQSLGAGGTATAKPSASSPPPSWKSQNPQATALYAKGSEYQRAQDYAKALAAYKQAVALDPDFEAAYYGIVVTAYSVNDRPALFGALKRLEALRPNDPEPPFQQGVHYLAGNQHPEAIAALQRAIRLKPDHASAHIQLGIAYAGVGKYAEAVAALQEAIRLEPSAAQAHYNLGATYVLQTRYADAIPELDLAIRLNPKETRAYRFLGRAYVRMGKKKEALQVHGKLLAIDKGEAEKLYAEINAPASATPQPPAASSAPAPAGGSAAPRCASSPSSSTAPPCVAS